MRFSLHRTAAALGVAGSLILAGAVAAMTVQPVAVDMKMIGREMSAPVRVENNGPVPLPVEIRIVETDMTEGTVRASDRVSGDMIQILYNFQIMVNVASNVASPAQLSVVKGEIATNDAGKPVAAFTISNSGKNYGYLSNNPVTVVHKSPAGEELMRRVLTGNDVQQTIGFGLVGPEKTRRFVSPIELTSAEGTVEVTLGSAARR